MKIKISEYEQYNISIPEEIDKQSFLFLVSRLHNLAKLFARDEMTNIVEGKKLEEKEAQHNTTQDNEGFVAVSGNDMTTGKILRENRTLFIELLKLWDKRDIEGIIKVSEENKFNSILKSPKSWFYRGACEKIKNYHNVRKEEYEN